MVQKVLDSYDKSVVFLYLLTLAMVCFWVFGTHFKTLFCDVVRRSGAITGREGMFFVAVGLCLLSVVSLFIANVKVVTFENMWQLSKLGDESDVTWTLNMFEMDLGTHRGICLNGTSPPQNKTWPWYINHTDTPPNPVLDNVNIKFLALYFPQWYPASVNGNKDDWRYFHNPEFTHNRESILITRPLNNIYYDPRCMEQRHTQAAPDKK
jgi:hypothetical protein